MNANDVSFLPYVTYQNKTENPSSPYPRALYQFTALGLIWARGGLGGAKIG
jgi:hypothetical protein